MPIVRHAEDGHVIQGLHVLLLHRAVLGRVASLPTSPAGTLIDRHGRLRAAARMCLAAIGALPRWPVPVVWSSASRWRPRAASAASAAAAPAVVDHLLERRDEALHGVDRRFILLAGFVMSGFLHRVHGQALPVHQDLRGLRLDHVPEFLVGLIGVGGLPEERFSEFLG